MENWRKITKRLYLQSNVSLGLTSSSNTKGPTCESKKIPAPYWTCFQSVNECSCSTVQYTPVYYFLTEQLVLSVGDPLLIGTFPSYIGVIMTPPGIINPSIKFHSPKVCLLESSYSSISRMVWVLWDCETLCTYVQYY